MRVYRALRFSFLLSLIVCVGGLFPPSVEAQQDDRRPPPIQQDTSVADGEPLELTLRGAVRTALEQNHNLQDAELELRTADAQVREAWGNLYPSLDLSGSYTRNVVTANPFAGSDAATQLGGDGETDWLAFNERRRLDPNAPPPITFPDFQQRQRDSLAAAGLSLEADDNPFGVDNEFQGGLQLTQTLYSKQAFASVRGSQQFKDVRQYARDRQVQETTNDVVTAFYQALLATERARVREQRVTRAERTLQEVSQQVDRGVVPKAQRLGAEVEQANARTQMIDARNAADAARDDLKRTMGLSADRPITLDGDLEERQDDGLEGISLESISLSEAVSQALDNRPDLQRARLNVELRGIEKDASRSEFFPRVEAVANFNYSGRVPDDRSRIQTTDPDDPTNPFFYEEQSRGFFNDDFWNPSVSVGLQLSWNLFNGFQSSARVQQAEVQRRQAEVQLDQLRDAVAVEVRRAVRDLETAREQIDAQETNVRRAELNYDHVSKRVSEGVATPTELREASDQLDESRLNYLQAVYDYLVARSDLETALGRPLTPTSESYLMTDR
ncbi:MAG: TolC family protein [Salinivenus sp.]